MILHQRPLRTIYDILSLIKSTLLTADNFLWCKIIPFSTDYFVSFSIENNHNLTVLRLSHLTSYTHTTSNLYLANSLVTALREPDTYKLLTIQVPNLISLSNALVVPKDQSRAKAHVFVS